MAAERIIEYWEQLRILGITFHLCIECLLKHGSDAMKDVEGYEGVKKEVQQFIDFSKSESFHRDKTNVEMYSEVIVHFKEGKSECEGFPWDRRLPWWASCFILSPSPQP